MSLILRRRKLLLAAPALVLPYRRADAQGGMKPGPGTPHAAPGAAWTLINSLYEADGAGPYTTSAMDTTGANFLVAGMGYFTDGGITPVITDSKGNSWSGFSAVSFYTPPGQQMYNSLFFSTPTSVGTGNTFSFSGVTGVLGGSITVAAFKSATGTPFFDVGGGLNQGYDQNYTFTGTSLSAGSVTPQHANDLVLIHLVANTTVGISTFSIDSGYTIIQQSPAVVGVSYGHAFAWSIKSALTSPTWTLSAATGDSGTSSNMLVIGSV